MNSKDIEVIRTQVGDRYVAAKMHELDLSLGGEQSGHVIVGGYATTGDGLVAALQMLALIQEEQKPLSEVANIYIPLPQITRNLPLHNINIMEDIDFKAAIILAEQSLAGSGRVLVRKSGTENLIRIMAEGENLAQVNYALDIIEKALN